VLPPCPSCVVGQFVFHRSSVSVGVPFSYPLVMAVRFVRAKKVRPADWYGSKDRASQGRVALNVLGSLTYLAFPPVNH
jgi:hypothetical protein